MRVPMIIVPPKNMNVPAGRSNAFASLLDLYPTLVDLCGIKVPDGLDGLSLKPVVTGTRKEVRDHIVTTLGRSTFCIRKGDAKLIRYYDGSEEFYDLKSDPHEFNNRIGDKSQAPRITELRQLAPEDKHYRQFVRYGRYKAVIDTRGEMKLYDMLHPKSGIGEHAEVSESKPGIVRVIKDHLKRHRITERHVTMPGEK